MRKLLLLLLVAVSVQWLGAQSESPLPEFDLKKKTFESNLKYLASDDMQGRDTGSPGGERAAQFIAKLFESYGLLPANGADGYFQKINFARVAPPAKATLGLDGQLFTQGDNLVVFKGAAFETKAKAVFAGHGWIDASAGIDDYEGLDVKGKLVFVLPGTPGSNSPGETFGAIPKKKKYAMEHGAIGVVELYRMQFPWRFFKRYFSKERLELADEPDGPDNPSFFYAFMQEGVPNPVIKLEDGDELVATVSNSGVQSNPVVASNVVGVLEGSDPALKDEYILVSAHYDHIGTAKNVEGSSAPQDTVFNGARDNGMGVMAMLASIKAMVQKPPKRSIVFLACTGEEKGMIGSSYYAEHPLVPLEKTVFNLNNDGGGYNTTEMFSIIGYDRTNVSGELEAAGKTFGLSIVKDPAKNQNLYERSDNIMFARKGIPAIDFAPGMTEMDEEIMKYYHQVADNPDSVDYDYLLKFCQAFAHATRLIADKAEAPSWTPGDKYDIR